VSDLATSASGELFARVRGSHQPFYTTTVSLGAGRKGSSLQSDCTCPVGSSCKHAVAVVAEYLDALGKKRAVPATDRNDPRWADLGEHESDSPAGAKPQKTTDADIEAHLRGKSQSELADLVVSLTHRFPELRKEFQDRLSLMSGDVGRIVNEARRDIKRITAEEAWRTRWTGQGHTPDYTPISQRFERLLELGHPNEVVTLGHEFIRDGLQQIGQSNDDGETSRAFSRVIPVVFEAVAVADITGPQRLLFVIDAILADEYDLLASAADKLLDRQWTKADWSAVADELAKRMSTTFEDEDEDSISRDYRRQKVAKWLTRALAAAGRDDELETLYEQEARATGSYKEIVDFYLERREHEKATTWASEGIAATAEKWPGIAHSLAAKLSELAARRKQWDVVAAHAAAHFFQQPSRELFHELVSAAKKANVEQPVREMALRFLETGVMPYSPNTTTATTKTTPAKPSTAVRKAGKPRPVVPPSRVTIDPNWPLPVPAYLEPMIGPSRGYDTTPRPRLEVLLDIALAAKNTADVLKWYDRLQAKPKPELGYRMGVGYADQVATAVADTHPERALAIFTAALNSQLPHADQNAYAQAAGYLKKLKTVYEALHRAAEWDTLVADIRMKYRHRPKFIEALDRMQGNKRTIVQEVKKGKK
nr:SWIM zinc finger family protein [Fimbriiglobus sp.]